MNYVSLPLDFERSEAVRIFLRKLEVFAIEKNIDVKLMKLLGPLYAFRIWMEWATSGQEFRPLKAVAVGQEHAWDREDLTYIIESFCDWTEMPSGLVSVAILSGYIKVEKRGEVFGLVLNDFWKANKHLSPDFVSIPKSGGLARAAKLREEEANRMAEDRRKIFESQGILLFGSEALSPEEEKLCYALLIRLDRACGRPVRSGSDFDEDIMQRTLKIVRTFTQEQISAVEAYLLENREDPKVIKVPERIVINFAKYVEDATHGK